MRFVTCTRSESFGRLTLEKTIDMERNMLCSEAKLDKGATFLVSHSELFFSVKNV